MELVETAPLVSGLFVFLTFLDASTRREMRKTDTDIIDRDLLNRLPEYLTTPNWEFIKTERCIWINGFNGLLGRYNLTTGSWDIHDQDSRCLDCSAHESIPLRRFFELMAEYHNFNLNDVHSNNLGNARPEKLRASNQHHS